MKKILLPLLLLLALTACGPRDTTETLPPSSAVPSMEPTETVQEEIHLEFFDQIDWYNGHIDEHDFVLSEIQQDGRLFYQFENKAHGVVILASPTGEGTSHDAILTYQDQSLAFEMPIFILGYGTVSGSASLHLADLTEDGIPEVVYIYGGGGTGAWKDQAKVFDLAAMTEYVVSWDNALLEEAVSITPIALVDDAAIKHTAVVEITMGDHTAWSSFYSKNDDLPEKLFPSFGGHESITLQDGKLMLISAFTTEAHVTGLYLGALTVPLVLNKETGVFCPGTAYALEVYDPVEILSRWMADLTHDGTDETVTVCRLSGEDGEFLVTVTDVEGSLLWQDRAGAYRGGGHNGIYLYTRDSVDYLMYWRPALSQGVYFPSYRIFSLDAGDGTATYEEGSIQYSVISEEELLALDTDTIRSFQAEVNALLADSAVLISTYNNEEVWSTPDAPCAPLWDSGADEWETRQEAAR